MRRNQAWCFFMAAAVVAALLPAPTMAGRLELKNEISGVTGVRKARLAVRCWSNEDDLGWDMLKPTQSRIWKFTTMNMWPFRKTEFRCQFRSGFGTTSQDVVTVFSVQSGFRKECGDGGDECIWVAKRDGFYQRRIVRDENDRKSFVDILKSKWVWKW
ncbi:Plant self-incompatibility protein S1 family [Raphanus sativus]|uniref:S-protein homolog n=1 Tax=Raphanus sativus TaxID=3726 RepID=A0A6J0NCQ9_RAPSA|nr:S-protein homolog 13 [Raphanus sativus]KAJ4900602.1 Plant self-incompatibility protein S1 family [Raphanus sativus]